MAQGYEVLNMLIPEGGWSIQGNDFSGITFHTCNPITEQEFIDGFSKVEEWKNKKTLEEKLKKDAILKKIGLTEEEVAVLLA